VVALRHREQRHDDLQRIPDRDLVAELAPVLALEHAPHQRAGAVLHDGLEPLDVGRHEVRLGEAAVLLVVRVVHVDHGPHELPAGRGRLGDADAQVLVVEQEGLGLGDEHVRVLAHLDHVRMLADRPERRMAGGLGPVQRVFVPQAVEHRMHALRVCVKLVAGDLPVQFGNAHRVVSWVVGSGEVQRSSTSSALHARERQGMKQSLRCRSSSVR
jgi:hypothetical protein